MRGRFRHSQHVLRAGVVLLLGFVAFLVLRWVMIPSDFGVYGFYRAGALDDVKAQPIAYAGRAACEDCHAGTYDRPGGTTNALQGAKPAEADPVKDNRHFVLRCEACHGPLAFHVADQSKPVAKVGVDGLCLSCHAQLSGRPDTQPQVLKSDHSGNDPCLSCHRPHRPKSDD
jgi:hypothetical protein